MDWKKFRAETAAAIIAAEAGTMSSMDVEYAEDAPCRAGGR